MYDTETALSTVSSYIVAHLDVMCLDAVLKAEHCTADDLVCTTGSLMSRHFCNKCSLQSQKNTS